MTCSRRPCLLAGKFTEKSIRLDESMQGSSMTLSYFFRVTLRVTWDLGYLGEDGSFQGEHSAPSATSSQIL